MRYLEYTCTDKVTILIIKTQIKEETDIVIEITTDDKDIECSFYSSKITSQCYYENLDKTLQGNFIKAQVELNLVNGEKNENKLSTQKKNKIIICEY